MKTLQHSIDGLNRLNKLSQSFDSACCCCCGCCCSAAVNSTNV